MTADALAVHNLHGFEGAIIYKAIDTARLLWKEPMACLAGDEFRVLVLSVREKYRAV